MRRLEALTITLGLVAVAGCEVQDVFPDGARFTDEPALDEAVSDVFRALGDDDPVDVEASHTGPDEAELAAAELADAEPRGAGATLELTIPRPVYMGWHFEARVSGVRPGDVVTLFSSTRRGNGPCPQCRRNGCLDLVRPVRHASARAGANGVAELVVPTSYAEPQIRFVQAFVTVGLAAESDVERLAPLPQETDSDGDRAFDAAEAWFGTDPRDRDTDNDGIRDGADPWPFERGPFDSFRPRDPVVSDPSSLLPDPEFDMREGRLVWQDAGGTELWVGGFDLRDGVAVPSDGRGAFVTDRASNMPFTGNGPEWVETAQESLVLYSVPSAGARSGHRVAYARQNASGAWIPALMPGSTSGFAPLGRRIVNAPVPWILYFDLDENGGSHLYVRQLENPASEVQLPRTLVTADNRFAELPQPLLVGSARPAANAQHQQIYLFDPTDRSVTWITDDPFYKFDTYVWRDPRSGDRMALTGRGRLPFALDEIAVYREVGPGPWRLEKVITGPPAFPWVRHPRVLTHDGRSYVTWIPSKRRTVRDGGLGQVWLASTDADDDLIRRIDSGAGGKIDPEPVLNGVRPWVVYSQGTESRTNPVRVIRRAELGLD